MVIFGGSDEKNNYSNDIWILDTESWHWTVPKVSGISIPSVRTGHKMCIVQGNSSGSSNSSNSNSNGNNNGKTFAYVFGGCGANGQFLNDIHVLNTGKKRGRE